MLRKSLIFACLIYSVSISAFAGAQKLPFVGERSYNFLGGSGTTEIIIIHKDGMVSQGGVGDTNAGGSRYIGKPTKFQNPICTDEYCYKFTTKTVEMLDRNKKPVYECSSSGIFYGELADETTRHRCIQELYKIK